MAGLAVGLVVAVGAVAVPARMASAEPMSVTSEAPSEGAALEAARGSGRRVEVTSARSELTQVFAEPDGRLTLESAVVPQRARRPDGSWAPIDLTLQHAADGSLRPAVSVADVRFSGGGTGPLVTLVRAGRTMTMSWPDPLPAPEVDGDSATYPGVLPDVDLVVRATHTGFTHVLVVRSASAAADPAVRQIRFDLGGDTRVSPLPGGGLQAIAGDVVVASAQPAAMWDSSASAGGAAKPQESADAGSSATGPGDAARTAPVTTTVTSSDDLVLTPDPALLSADAKFPVFVDPPWSTGRSRWAYATHNNSNNADTSVARVGWNPDSGVRYRSYFEFPLSAVKGKHVESAYVQMKLDHSWSCGNTPTHMYHVSAIGTTPRTRWAARHIQWLAAADSHANEGSGCSDSPQPDMTVNFIHASVTSVIQQHATKQLGAVTVGFCACNANGDFESSKDRWKKFFPANAKLIVDYSSIPGKPGGLQVSGVACPATGRLSIGTLTPTLSAVYPDADRTQALSAAYEWLEIPASGAYNDATPRKPAPGRRSVPAGGRATSAPLTGLVAGRAYAFRTRATDPPPYSLTSVWSAWCEFVVDTSVPPPPTITEVTLPSGPGTGGTFTLTSTASDVVKFRYGWTNPPLSEVAATGTTAKTATVHVSAARYGQNTLYAYAIDATANKGNDASFEFVVARPAPPVTRWGLETYPGVDQTAALADQQPTLSGDTPLTATNVGWAGDVHLVGGQTAMLNGTSSKLTTAGPVVDTTGSFGVAAWVRLSALPTTGDTVVAAQDGTSAAGFHLGTRLEGSPPAPRWSFLMKDTADQASATRAAVGAAALTTADVGRWTHLAGVYDKPAGKVRLYVNGSLAAETDRTAAPWSAGGTFVVGRGQSAGAPGNWWKGAVADVQLFDRALVGHDFTGQLATDPGAGEFTEPGFFSATEVGRWDFDHAARCYQPGAPENCRAQDRTGMARQLSLARGVDVGLGRRSDGLLLDSTHWVDDPHDPLYGTATQEFGQSQRNTVPDPQPPQLQDTPVLRTDEPFTVSAWVRLDSPTGRQTVLSQDTAGIGLSGFDLYYDGGNGGRWGFSVRNTAIEADPAKASTITVTADDPGDWHHLVGVLDPTRRQIRLYVDGKLAAAATTHAGLAPWQATGPLVVGRSDRSGGPGDWLIGALDDVVVFQGVLTDAAVANLNDVQSATET